MELDSHKLPCVPLGSLRNMIDHHFFQFTMRRRHRHGPYYLANSQSRWEKLKPIFAFLIVGAVLFFIGSWFIEKFDLGRSVKYAAVTLTPEERGIVRVSLEDEEWKRTEQELKLYPGDRITTGTNANASLRFFDGTFVRLDEQSNVKIIESDKREEGSKITLHLETGSFWIATPPAKIYTGSILRTITTNWFSSDFASSAEVIVKDRSLVVFSEDTIGSSVNIIGIDAQIVIGEGQLLSLPEDIDSNSDPYAYRSALDPRAMLSAFVEESRTEYGKYKDISVSDDEDERDAPIGPNGDEVPTKDEFINVTEPKNQDILQTATTNVKGTVSESVADVQINGYSAAINEETNIFSLELALPDKDEVDITAEAIAENGEILETVLITVFRDLQPPEPPTFISPAKNGETFQTQQERIEIIGEAPADAVGIIVNDYRLQFFQPGDETWKYLATTELDNLRYGENIFEAVAIKKGGLRSEPMSITVILGGDTEGVVDRPDDEEIDEIEVIEEIEDEEEVSAPEEDDVTDLPNNAPLAPGTLFVRSPAPGLKYTAEGPEQSELLIEGTAPVGSYSIWVNDYRLRLFEPAKGFWNYIADTKIGTLKRGENLYEIIARDKDSKIIDRVTYTIIFNPR